jgi:hypothetical protein
MHRSKEYKLEEVPIDVNHEWLRENMNGWPETALRIHPSRISDMLTGCPRGEPGIMIMCDSDGHAKELDFTMFRATDGAPLVGKLYWLSYKEIYILGEMDYSMHALTKNQLESILKMLGNLGWSEIVFEEAM